mgnify:FL=1
MTDDLIEIYKNSEKLMPLVHLPVQSGSDRVLKLMNRKHDIKNYLKIFYKFKKINPKIQFSSDFIIGYPGEREKDFDDTIKLIKEVKFINSYSFIFSPRPGTKASEFKNFDKEKALLRLEKVQEVLFKNQINMNNSLEGQIIDVLVENQTEDNKKLFGKSEYMTSVIFDGSDKLIGKVVKVKILNSNQNTLFGLAIDPTHRRVA